MSKQKLMILIFLIFIMPFVLADNFGFGTMENTINGNFGFGTDKINQNANVINIGNLTYYTSYNSSYNVTYDKWAYNQTYSGSTYNESYNFKNSSRWILNGTAIGYTTGYVGIGTLGPAQLLDVNGSWIFRNYGQLYGANVFNGYFGDGGGLFTVAGHDTIGIRAVNGVYLSGANSATPQMVLTQGGNVGIGTSNPSYILDITKLTSSGSTYPAVKVANPNTVGTAWAAFNFMSGNASNMGVAGLVGQMVSYANNNLSQSFHIRTSSSAYPIYIGGWNGSMGRGITLLNYRLGVDNMNPLEPLDVIGNSYLRGNVNITNNLNVTGNVHIDGNVSFKRPYGMFSSNVTQIAGASGTPYPVTFNNIEDNYQVYKSSDNANFSFGQTGDYLIELSAIVDVDTPNKVVEIWVQKNDVNIPRSNTRVKLPSATTETLVVVPFILDMNMTDKFRVMWATDDAGSRILYTTNTSYSPESPSIIMTISKISEVSEL